MDLFKLTAKLALDTGNFVSGLAKAEAQMVGFAKKATTTFAKVGKVGFDGLVKGSQLATKGVSTLGKATITTFKAAGKVANVAVGAVKAVGKAAVVAGTAVTALGASVIPIVTQSVSAFGEFQQLEGGVKKLYGESWVFVAENAEKAYKTAGISANQYMQQATVFAAKLVNDCEGDTVRAAELTDKAIQDMADNVNTFGSDMESVQNAYRGFSRGNFTMLDNLNIGYAGTKEGMQDLLKDASDYYFETTGEMREFSIDSFADIIEAIGLIQKKQGIAGTTASEAASTVEGSLNSLKASWENLLSALGSGDTAKISRVTGELADAAVTALSNLTPVIESASKGLVTVINRLAPIIARELPKLLETLLPNLIDAGISIADALFKGLKSVFKVSNITKLIKQIGRRVKAKITDLLGLSSDASFGDILTRFAERLREGVKKLGQDAKVLIGQLLGITDENGNLLDTGEEATWANIGFAIAEKIQDGFKSAKKSIAILLGFTTEEAEDATWSQIGVKIGQTLRKAIKGVKTSIGQLLGITGPNGKNLTTGEETTWEDIGKTLADKLHEGASAVFDSIAAFLGLEGDTSIGDIVIAGLNSAIAAFSGANSFLKRLLLGEGGISNLQAQLGRERGLDPSEWGNIEVSWANVVDVLFDEFTGKFGGLKLFGEGGLIDTTMDIAEGVAQFFIRGIGEIADWLGDPKNVKAFNQLGRDLGKIATQLVLAIGKALPQISTAVVEFLRGAIEGVFKALSEADLEDTPFLKTIRDAIVGLAEFFDLFDEEGNMKMPGWIEDLLTALGMFQKGADGKGQLKLPEWLYTEKTNDKGEKELGGIVGGILNLVNAVGKLLGFIDPKTGTFKLPDWLKLALDAIKIAAEAIAWVINGIATALNWIANVGYNWDKTFNQQTNQTAITPDGVEVVLAQANPNDPTKPMDTSTSVAYFSGLTNGYFGGPDDTGRYSVIPGRAWDVRTDGMIDRLTGSFGNFTRAGVSPFHANTDFSMGYAVWQQSAQNAQVNTQSAEVDAGIVVVNGDTQGSPKAIGMWSVPYDDFSAKLHRDEMVLTASQARDYRAGIGGGNEMVVAAIQRLSNEMANLKIMVGEKVFGKTVVDYSGKRMNGYLGRTESRAYAGYGWG